MTPVATKVEHEAWLREIGQLRPNNHELWRYLQRRVADPVSLRIIADELGVDEPALVVWMLSYTGPKRKPYQSKNGTPIGKVKAHMPSALAAAPREPLPSVAISIDARERSARASEATRYGRWVGKPEELPRSQRRPMGTS